VPAIRDDVLSEAPTGRYSFMEPAPSAGPGRSFNAMDIDCPACVSSAGDMCTLRMSVAVRGKPAVPLICRDRAELVRLMSESGELHGAAIPPRPRTCAGCRRRKNQRGTKYLACENPSHRCVVTDHGNRCAGAVLPGTKHCPKHAFNALDS
jgi:hypothetical protein